MSHRHTFRTGSLQQKHSNAVRETVICEHRDIETLTHESEHGDQPGG